MGRRTSGILNSFFSGVGAATTMRITSFRTRFAGACRTHAI